MSETALDRVSRSLNLIPFLSKNPGLSIPEIAHRFDTTPTQISKDLSLLHMCGLPGYSHLELLDIDYEDPNYVSITDPQVLDRPRSLTQIEGLALVLGLSLLLDLTANEHEKEKIEKLQSRLSHSLSESQTRYVSIDNAVLESPFAIEISESIRENTTLTIRYLSATSDSESEREISPRSLNFRDGIGYVQALSLTDHAIRTFRLDRITSVTKSHSTLIGESITKSAQPSATSRIRLPREGFSFLEAHDEVVIDTDFDGAFYTVHLNIEPGEWLIRTLLALPYSAEVLDPSWLSSEVQERAQKALAQYKS